MFRKIIGFVLIVSAVVSSGGAALADDYHYTNLLVGDRASGMAGAYAAVSDDATGLYYNPAGVAYTTGRNMSASVNAYYDNEKTYKSVIGGNGWTRHSSSLLPNYFGVVQPLGIFKVGISYAVPDSIMEDQSQTFDHAADGGNLQLSSSIQPYNPGAYVSSYIINFNDENNVYEFGPSIAMEAAKNFSAGITLYYYQRKELQILNQMISTSTGGYEWDNFYYHNEEQGVRPILGFMWSPIDSVSLGLAVSKIMIFNSETSSQSAFHRQGIGVLDPSTNTVVTDASSIPSSPTSYSIRRNYPTQVSLGIGWFPSQSLLFSADLNYYTEVDAQSVNVDNQSFLVRPRSEALVNIALGTEYYLSKTIALRGGLYTNYANTPTVKTDGTTNQAEHIDLYGATASVSHFTRNTSVTLGGGLTYGTGKAQMIADSSSVQTADAMGWMFFVSSSYSY